MAEQTVFRFTEHERQALAYFAESMLFQWDSLCRSQPSLTGRENDLRQAWEKLGPHHLWARVRAGGGT